MPPLVRDQTTGLLSQAAAESSDGGCVCKVKCVLVGDGAVGKTSLIVSYTTNGYPTEYVPTAFDNYSVIVTVDNQPVQLQLCDTAGQDDFDSLRPLCYPQTHVFLLCFSVVCPTSFSNVSEKWIPEIRKHCPKAPLVLVGTKCDLRNDVKVLIDLARYQEQPVSEQRARHLASHIGAVAYLECSALTQKNLKEVFDRTILVALQLQKPDVASWGRSKGKRFLRLRSNSLDNAPLTAAIRCAHHAKASAHSNGDHKKRGWKRFCCLS